MSCCLGASTIHGSILYYVYEKNNHGTKASWKEEQRDFEGDEERKKKIL